MFSNSVAGSRTAPILRRRAVGRGDLQLRGESTLVPDWSDPSDLVGFRRWAIPETGRKALIPFGIVPNPACLVISLPRWSIASEGPSSHGLWDVSRVLNHIIPRRSKEALALMGLSYL